MMNLITFKPIGRLYSENAPIGGLYTMQQLVGSFIGVAGYWGDAFPVEWLLRCRYSMPFRLCILRGCDGDAYGWQNAQQ
ncbi:MAG: hypothetical protein IPL33_22460 [Sphingobacteriales bacterium]|nr:hypothetical protein [Sphingobacteriales bacterium]